MGADLPVPSATEDHLGGENPDAFVGAGLDATSPGKEGVRKAEDAHVIAVLDRHEREKTGWYLLVFQVADVDHENAMRNVVRQRENRK